VSIGHTFNEVKGLASVQIDNLGREVYFAGAFCRRLSRQEVDMGIPVRVGPRRS
jgi:hypothetical protein